MFVTDLREHADGERRGARQNPRVAPECSTITTYRHRRRHVHCAGMGVRVLKMAAGYTHINASICHCALVTWHRRLQSSNTTCECLYTHIYQHCNTYLHKMCTYVSIHMPCTCLYTRIYTCLHTCLYTCLFPYRCPYTSLHWPCGTDNYAPQICHN